MFLGRDAIDAHDGNAAMRAADGVAHSRRRDRLWGAQRRRQHQKEVRGVDDGAAPKEREQKQLVRAEEILPCGQHKEFFAS